MGIDRRWWRGLRRRGVVLAVGKITGGRLPGWAMPIAAGSAMIAMAIYNAYGWFPRPQATLPEGLEIVETVEARAWYRPRTLTMPFVERFAAVDMPSVRTHEGQPDFRLADVYLFGRWAPVHKLPVLADCAEWRRAALTDGITFAADGSVMGADWANVAADDAIVVTLCGAGS